MSIGWLITLYRAYERISKLCCLQSDCSCHWHRIYKEINLQVSDLDIFVCNSQMSLWVHCCHCHTCSYLLLLFLCFCWYSVFSWQLVSASKAGSDEEALDDWIKISSEKTENSLLHKVAFQCKQWLPYECCDHKQPDPLVPKELYRGVFIFTHSITEWIFALFCRTTEILASLLIFKIPTPNQQLM